MQLSPHPVLLHVPFYHDHLKSLLAEWALFWLRSRQELIDSFGSDGGVSAAAAATGFDPVSRLPAEAEANVRAYIAGEELSSPPAVFVSSRASPNALRLLNLSRDWLNIYLPHCFSKIDRVTYGLLRQEEDRVEEEAK